MEWTTEPNLTADRNSPRGLRFGLPSGIVIRIPQQTQGWGGMVSRQASLGYRGLGTHSSNRELGHLGLQALFMAPVDPQINH